MTDELKPCPFCGDKMEHAMGDFIRHRVQTKDCPIAQKGHYYSIAAWNRRADHVGDADKMVGSEPDGDLVEQISDIIFENVDDEDHGHAKLRGLDEAARAVVALFAEREKALHPDDKAVDLLASAMKAKLAKQRAKGYGGWDNPEQCPAERLAGMLIDHIAKGDPVDVANFAMMLFCREGGGQAMADAAIKREKAAGELLRALERADEFITNGIDLGFIRMPDEGVPDPAHETPGVVRAAIAAAKAAGIGGAS